MSEPASRRITVSRGQGEAVYQLWKRISRQSSHNFICPVDLGWGHPPFLALQSFVYFKWYEPGWCMHSIKCAVHTDPLPPLLQFPLPLFLRGQW